MPERSYQVRVAGLGRNDGQVGTDGPEVTAHRIRTLLVARLSEQHPLPEFLRQLRTFGLEVVDVRRLPYPELLEARRGLGPTVSSWLSEHGGYELTVSGGVEPGLRAALAPYGAELEELHKVLRMEASDDVEFVELVLLLEARGVRIASIALVEQPAPATVRSLLRHRLPQPPAGMKRAG